MWYDSDLGCDLVVEVFDGLELVITQSALWQNNQFTVFDIVAVISPAVGAFEACLEGRVMICIGLGDDIPLSRKFTVL